MCLQWPKRETQWGPEHEFCYWLVCLFCTAANQDNHIHFDFVFNLCALENVVCTILKKNQAMQPKIFISTLANTVQINETLVQQRHFGRNTSCPLHLSDAGHRATYDRLVLSRALQSLLWRSPLNCFLSSMLPHWWGGVLNAANFLHSDPVMQLSPAGGSRPRNSWLGIALAVR